MIMQGVDDKDLQNQLYQARTHHHLPMLCCAGVPDAEASMMRHLHVLQIVMVSKQFVLALQLRPLHAWASLHQHLQQWERGCC